MSERPADVILEAASTCSVRALATVDGRVLRTDDGGRSWRTVFALPRPAEPQRHSALRRTRLEVDTTGLLAGALGAGLLQSNLRDLWYFGDGETGLDFLDDSGDGGPLEPSEPPDAFPEAGYWSIGADTSPLPGFGGRELRLLSPTQGAVTALWFRGDTLVIATSDGCFGVGPYGVQPEACSDAPAAAELDCATPRAAPSASGPPLQSLIDAAEARFGVARQVRREAADRARAAAWVPRFAIVGGYALVDRGAILAAAFLDDPTPFSDLQTRGGYGFGNVGDELADGQNITFQTDGTLAFPYVAAVLSWPLDASPPVASSDVDEDALRAEITHLWRTRAVLAGEPPPASPLDAALHQLAIDEADALIGALTGAVPLTITSSR